MLKIILWSLLFPLPSPIKCEVHVISVTRYGQKENFTCNLLASSFYAPSSSSMHNRKKTKPSASSPSTQSTRPPVQSWSHTRDHYLSILAFLCFVCAVVWVTTDRVPQPRNAKDTPLHEFSEERARQFLTPLLEKIGYRILMHLSQYSITHSQPSLPSHPTLDPSPRLHVPPPPSRHTLDTPTRTFIERLLWHFAGVPGTPENDIYTAEYIVKSLEEVQNSALCKVHDRISIN